jgi:NADH:ubiquinone oxidoreductase subunit F (NADH-binding)
MGTPLRELLDAAGGPRKRRRLVAAVSGAANRFLPAARFDAPLSYEGMASAGSGLGAAGFIVFDDRTDLVAAAAGLSRFLAVESCGQCTPCKQDGLAIAELLERIASSDGAELDLIALADRARTVSDEARCFLASQHEAIASSALELFDEELRNHVNGRRAARPVPIVPIADIVGGEVVLDLTELEKQPDWTYSAIYSGQSPADRVDQR